jgi:hypothetical protein
MARLPAYLKNRRLCSDGVCLGLIGDDGRCRACGRRAAPPQEQGLDDGFVIERRLCHDGACLGVLRARRVGPPYRSHAEGVCPVCGRLGAI